MEPLVLMYELEERLDGTIGIGNSIHLTEAEARLRIEQKSAKSPFAPIGEVPENWTGEAVEDGSNF